MDGMPSLLHKAPQTAPCAFYGSSAVLGAQPICPL
jgi:hypothetical protein